MATAALTNGCQGPVQQYTTHQKLINGGQETVTLRSFASHSVCTIIAWKLNFSLQLNPNPRHLHELKVEKLLHLS